MDIFSPPANLLIQLGSSIKTSRLNDLEHFCQPFPAFKLLAGVVHSESSAAMYGRRSYLPSRIEVLKKPSSISGTRENGSFRGNGNHSYVVGVSPEMQPVQRLIFEIAPTDIPVLLLGESGTGKEIAALQIHSRSSYKNLPFMKLSCAALTPETLEQGVSNPENSRPEKNGKVTGTVFLDEIAELDANCQRRLLHSISDGDGVTAQQSFRGRVVSCTTRDMESEVQSGRFRSELFYRLNGVCLQLPPLRRRREDIPLLVRHFLGKYSKVFQRAEMTLSDQTLQLLVEYSWPGNIRQLENVIRRIVAVENEDLGIADLKVSPVISRALQVAATSQSLKAASRAASRQAERELILQTLERTRWNRKRAAEALQISYKSLLFKLKQIQVPGSEQV